MHLSLSVANKELEGSQVREYGESSFVQDMQVVCDSKERYLFVVKDLYACALSCTKKHASKVGHEDCICARTQKFAGRIHA
jgi:hypothetical protein